MRVRDWMTPAPVTIEPGDRLADARARMDAGGFRRLPVVDETGRLVGILTDRDLREHRGHLPDTRVTGAMVERPLTVTPDTTIEEAADLMLARRIGGLPVVEGNTLVGIVTVTDLLRGLLRGHAPADAEASRLSLELTAPTQTLGEVVRVLESHGGCVTAIHGDGGPGRHFDVYLTTGDPGPFAVALRQHGYVVRDARRGVVGDRRLLLAEARA